MPYTGHPDTEPSDEVRFLLGDTDAANPKLSDTEVAYLLSKADGNVYKAAYQGAIRLIGKYTAKQSKSVGPTSIQYGEQVQNYRAMLTELAKLGGRPLVGAPTAGGIDEPLVIGEADWEGQL